MLKQMPAVPTPDPCDHRVTSAPVLIQTVRGEWYTARWVVYVDQDEDGIPPCWELAGRDGLQLDREEVAQWFECAAVAELVEAAKKAQAMMAMPERIEPRHRKELCDAIARCEIVADPRLARVQGEQ